MVKKAVGREVRRNVEGRLVLFGMNLFYLFKYERRLSSGGEENLEI